MKKILKYILIIFLAIFFCYFIICATNLFLTRNMYKTTAIVTFVALPEGTVMGDFKDSDGIEHYDEPLFSSFRFLSFRAVKKVNMSEIEKYKGTEITILYDKENKTVINYDRLQKNIIINGVIILFLSFVLFFRKKQNN